MSNTLQVSMIETIKQLDSIGWSQRKIASELGVHRKTVRTYLQADSKCTISTDGSLKDGEQKSSPSKVGRQSFCVAHDETIRTFLKEGLSAQRIFQDLRSEKNFEGSYESVKRYVRQLKTNDELPFRRMEVLPGTECQIDYGMGAWIVDANGKRKKTNLFRATLSFSRKGYSDVSYTQETESFVRSIENACRSFGGVPERLVIDNLKAGVLKACVYDPDLNPKLRDFATHYGTCIMPSKVRTPRHKGKVERQVDYVQNNALKGRKFSSLAEQNEYLRTWEKQVADKRIHGTIRRQVEQMFMEEKPFLRPLPLDLFPAFQEGRRKVHRDGHIEVAKAYYSVPPEYNQREVWVRYDGRLVEVFTDKMEKITAHAQKEPGQRSTRHEHIPAEKISNPERGNEWMLQKAWVMGNAARAWAGAMLEKRGQPGTRVLNGLLSLRKKYSPNAINAGCAKALDAQAFTLKELRKHIESQSSQQSFTFLDEHPLIRGLDEYEQTINSKGLFE